jgi:hypothetical protein
LPSNLQEGLFRQLKKVSSRVKYALGENELDRLPGMIQEHQEIMLQLNQAGDCQDPELFHLMTEIKTEVQNVIQEIETRQSKIRGQMKVTANKKKLVRAYGA